MNTFTEAIFMNSYIILYSISIAICNFIWWQVMKKYHNPAWFFFFLFTIFISIWYFLYFLYFTWIEDPKLLLYISRWAFVSWVISLYSLVFCVGYLDLERKKLFSKWTIAVCIIYLFVLYIYLFTGGIIKGIEYSGDEHVYREVYGNLYSIGFALYPLFIVSFSIIAFRKLQKLEWLERIRIRRIIFALCVFLFSLIFLQAILPIFWIWILEKEIIFLFLFFIIYTSITLKKYYFTSSTYNIHERYLYESSHES